MFKLSLLVIICLSSISDAHRACSTDEKAAADIAKDPNLLYKKEADDKRWANIVKETGGHTKKWSIRNGYGWSGINNARRRLQLTDGNIDIPVIIHVLYNGARTSLQTADISSYSLFIDRLLNINANYNRENSDISTDPSWSHILGNMDMTFFLNKIQYYDVGSNSPYEWHGNAMKSGESGAAPIDPSHNLNIWFIQPDASHVNKAAYSAFPWDTDYGIVVNIALINGNWGESDYKQYRTIFSHEIGHWVGLYHIWGWSSTTHDTPTCDADDAVVDTPNMAAKYGEECPKRGVNTCQGGDADMFENFMSYADCINMFTDGQVSRARSNFAGTGNRKTFIEYKNNTIAKSYTFVNMIYFIRGTNSKCMHGDTKRIINLNEGVGGTAIFLCVSYSNNPYVDALTDLDSISTSPPVTCPVASYTAIDIDLNEGVSVADFVYLCFKKESISTTGKAITDLQVFSFPAKYTAATYDGWNILPRDFNEAAGGNWLYIGYKSIFLS